MSNEKSYTRITTIFIVLIAILSLATAFLVYTIQQNVGNYNKQADEYAQLEEEVSYRIQAILQQDSAKEQIANSYLQDLYLIDAQVKDLKLYNQTSTGNGTVTQVDIDKMGMEFAQKMERMVEIVQDTYVYDYSITWLPEDSGSLIQNNSFVASPIDDDIKFWVNTIFVRDNKTPQLLVIQFDAWTSTLYNNMTILTLVDVLPNPMDTNLDLNISYTNLIANKKAYSQLAGFYSSASNLLSSALISFAIAAVVLGFVVSVVDKKYQKISLIVGILVAVFSLFLFLQGTFGYLNLVLTGGGTSFY